MSIPEKIDNAKMGIKKGAYEREQKRQAHTHNRRKSKDALRKGEQPDSDYGKNKGWTT